MIKNPFVNALLAALYIVVIVVAVPGIISLIGEEETLLIPITILSLLVLSVALMALLFFYTPLRMFLDNKKDEALVFFTKTLGTFAGCVVVFIILLFVF